MIASTPGPWTVEDADDGGPEDDRTERAGGSALPFFIAAKNDAAFARWGLMGDYRGTRVAYVACNPAAANQREWATVEANARLIAAAPELLAMCRAIQQTDCDGDEWNPLMHRLDALVARLEVTS